MSTNNYPPTSPTNEGHGHVFERPDGLKAKCGGPKICMDCARDRSAKIVADVKAAEQVRATQAGVSDAPFVRLDYEALSAIPFDADWSDTRERRAYGKRVAEAAMRSCEWQLKQRVLALAQTEQPDAADIREQAARIVENLNITTVDGPYEEGEASCELDKAARAIRALKPSAQPSIEHEPGDVADQEALECPFCGSNEISDGEILTGDPSSGLAHTQSECQSCGAIGPRANLDAGEVDYGCVKAIAAWNHRATPGTESEDADPLQGAANWIVAGLSPVTASDIQRRLLIGYNRASRLFMAAKENQFRAQLAARNPEGNSHE